MGKMLFAVLGTLLLGSVIFAVTANPCSDGTPYGQCSTKTGGKYCTGLIANPTLQDNAVRCKCTDVPGYKTDPANSDACVAVASGCATNNPACKADESCVNNACVKKTGCTYNNPACLPTQECVNNECVMKSGCTYQNPPCPAGQLCQENECVAVGGSSQPAPAQETPQAPSTTTSQIDAGPGLIAYEPKQGGFCCASALAILAVGMFAYYKKE